MNQFTTKLYKGLNFQFQSIEMLEHIIFITTQHYIEIVNIKINNDIRILKEKL